MKNPASFPLHCALCLGVILAGCHPSRDGDHDHDHGFPSAPDSGRVPGGSVDQDGHPVLSLSEEARQSAGIEIRPAASAELPREVRGYARVLDPTPLIALAAERASARNALATSTREAERVRTLLQDGGNASERSLEQAESARRDAEIAVHAIELRLAAAWGSTLAETGDLTGLAEALAKGNELLVRLDLPAGDSVGQPEGGRFVTLDEAEATVAGRFLGPAPSMDPQTQGASFFFRIESNDAGLRPGQALTGWIREHGPLVTGVIVPGGAIVRARGGAWVYLREDESQFSRRTVQLGQPVDEGWLVTEGLKEGDLLVVAGAQMLFSEELKSGIQFGD